MKPASQRGVIVAVRAQQPSSSSAHTTLVTFSGKFSIFNSHKYALDVNVSD